MSSIVGPSLVSMLPMTILPMDAAIISRYTDLVESSQTILLELILEILDVILPTADMSVGVFHLVMWVPMFCIGCGVDENLGRCRRSPYHQCAGGGNAGMEGVPDKWVDG